MSFKVSDNISFQPLSLIPKTFDLVEYVIGPQACEILEIGCIAVGSIRLVDEIANYFFKKYPNYWVSLACFTGVTLAAVQYYIKKIRLPVFENKLEEIQSESLVNEKNALMIISDDCKDYLTRKEVFTIRKLAQSHAIERKVIVNKRQFFEFLQGQSCSRYNTLWFSCHGSENGVWLGDFFLSKNDFALIKLLSSKMRRNGKVVFESCQVAKGEENFARVFSYHCPGSTIFASRALFINLIGPKMDDEGDPHFKNMLGIDSTGIYRDDELLNPRYPIIARIESCYLALEDYITSPAFTLKRVIQRIGSVLLRKLPFPGSEDLTTSRGD
jgi:hypothetical protein